MIPVSKPRFSRSARQYVLDCFEKNWFSQGEYNLRFEKAFARHLRTKYALTCGNGTVALTLALKALGIGRGDEVIVPTLTFSASVSTIINAGATPVLVESDEETLNLSPAAVEKAITKKTKAIMVVHLYGLAADMDAIMRIARKHKLKIIEDAAEALGATYKGKALGTIGDIGTFSFYGNKILSTGEGGMCVTNSKKLAGEMSRYKNHGSSHTHTYWSDVVGLNGRMTNVQAALGLSQIEDFRKNLTARYRVFEAYVRALKKCPGIVLLPYGRRTYSPWMFTLRASGMRKEAVVAALRKLGVDSRPGFYPAHTMPAFKKYVKGKRFPAAERISKEIINLPTFAGLAPAEIRTVTAALKKVLAR